MIETVHITVLDTWSNLCNKEDCEILCKETHKDLDKALKNGFRVKCVTSCVLENRMLVHYVLERESNFNEIKKKGNCETCENYAGKTTTFDNHTDYLCKLGGWYCNTEGCESYKEKK